MTLTEKYWLTLLFTICRFLSILMLGFGIPFIILGIVVDPWFFTGLAGWPFMLMWGIVNLRYIHVLIKKNHLELSKLGVGEY